MIVVVAFLFVVGSLAILTHVFGFQLYSHYLPRLLTRYWRMRP
jgi:hypothetical protein